MKDVTSDILSIKNALVRAYEDTDADGGISPALSGIIGSENLLINFVKLIENEKWTSVILYFKCNRDEFFKEYDDLCDKDNDVISVLNIYCKKLVHDKPGEFRYFFIQGALRRMCIRRLSTCRSIVKLKVYSHKLSCLFYLKYLILQPYKMCPKLVLTVLF